MNKLVSALLIGVVFGLGITISGMINPAKVLNFFDIAGTWDPSLAFVMGGGLVTAMIGYRLVFGKMKAPLFDSAFPCRSAAPSTGSWSAAQRCSASAGALPASARAARSRRSVSVISETLVFVAATIAGIVLARIVKSRLLAPALA